MTRRKSKSITPKVVVAKGTRRADKAVSVEPAHFFGHKSAPISTESHKSDAGFTDFQDYLEHLIGTDQTVTLNISPSMAKIMLDRVKTQRTLVSATVQRYAREMSEGRWVLTGECLIFGTNGALLNGQHRLRAVIRSDKTIAMDVRFGIDPKSMPKIDRLRPRSAGDVFSMLGENNAANLAAMTRFVWQYENTGGMRIAWKEPEPEELWEYMDECHPNLRSYISTYREVKRTGWGLYAIISSLHYLCATIAGKEEADEFFYQFITGNGIGTWSKKHPIVKLRDEFAKIEKNKLKGKKVQPEFKAAMIIKAFNAWLYGKERTTLAWRSQNDTEKFPTIKS